MGHQTVVELLLGKDGVDVNKANNDGLTPLFRASQMGHEKVVELLLGKDGVDVNKANDDGDTPLMVAAHGIVRRLLLNFLDGDPFANHVYASDIYFV
jgi:L,D-peptidoglycan transpeptidase YkuD (ErfK/YbiS/YcfS/YnhG family)